MVTGYAGLNKSGPIVCLLSNDKCDFTKAGLLRKSLFRSDFFFFLLWDNAPRVNTLNIPNNKHKMRMGETC